jgi:hypothetical protein
MLLPPVAGVDMAEVAAGMAGPVDFTAAVVVDSVVPDSVVEEGADPQSIPASRPAAADSQPVPASHSAAADLEAIAASRSTVASSTVVSVFAPIRTTRTAAIDGAAS